MTAGQIADKLGISDITINYLPSEVMPRIAFEKNPIVDVDYYKNGCNFSKMIETNPNYQSETYFPNGINFIEPTTTAAENDKQKVLGAFPESGQDIFQRTIAVNQMINQKIYEESNNGS